jgi:hypothetical protein
MKPGNAAQPSIPHSAAKPRNRRPRKERLVDLNRFVTERQGWLTSIAGDVPVEMQCLPNSTLPAAVSHTSLRLSRPSSAVSRAGATGNDEVTLHADRQTTVGGWLQVSQIGKPGAIR